MVVVLALLLIGGTSATATPVEKERRPTQVRTQLDGNYELIESSDGSWAVAPTGSKVDSREMRDKDAGRGLEASITPPEPSEFDAMGLSSAAADGATALDHAVDLGLLPEAERETEEELGLMAANAASFLDDGCRGAENNTGTVYGCYARYRTNLSTRFIVRHHATGDQKSLWVLTRVRSGAAYNADNRVRAWKPAEKMNKNCASFSLSLTTHGATVSSTQPLCASLSPEIPGSGRSFDARWAGTAMSPRRGYGVHSFDRANGTQSGFTFRVSFYAT
jgi:hypothetical protein